MQAGSRLVVLEGLTCSGKTTLTKEPFIFGGKQSNNIAIDGFLSRPVPSETRYVDALDWGELTRAITTALASSPRS